MGCNRRKCKRSFESSNGEQVQVFAVANKIEIRALGILLLWDTTKALFSVNIRFQIHWCIQFGFEWSYVPAFQKLDRDDWAGIRVNRTWSWVTGAFGGYKGRGWRDVGEHLLSIFAEQPSFRWRAWWSRWGDGEAERDHLAVSRILESSKT